MHETDHLERAERDAVPPEWRGSRRRLRIVLFGAGSAALAGLSSACHESLTQVDSRVVAPATRPALDIAGSLPRLADLVTGDTRDAGAAVLGRWEDSWNMALAAGSRLRAGIYGSAAGWDLAFDTTSARTAIETIHATIAEIEGVAHPLPPRLSRQLAEARRLLGAAENARDAGDVTESVLATLRSADALRGTTPRMVALGLVESAERALGAAAQEAPDSGPTAHARARRLTEWARSAIDTGDYEKAIQRGYYACRLLGADIQ
ncbi:MAG: hypothetical protein OXU74_16335 [Gemmatimonadota bacterium]|nr:hypothetical protein [Gemmatimonadota bacterium]